MGDRTYYQLALPTTLRPRTLRAAATAFTGTPWTTQQAKQELGEHLHLNPAAVCITIEERLVGECRDAAEAVRDALHDRGVDVPFAVIEDPRYEWLGTLCRYHPQYGMHEVDCDATGTPLLTAHALRHITATTTGAEQVLAAIHVHLGTPWDTIPTGCQ